MTAMPKMQRLVQQDKTQVLTNNAVPMTVENINRKLMTND